MIKEAENYKINLDISEKEVKNLKEENEENLLKIEELAKKINDNEINIKGINLEKKEFEDLIKKKDKEINTISNENNNLKEDLEKLKTEIKNLTQINETKENKIKIFDEEKNNLVNNFFEKEKEFTENKNLVVNLEQTIEKINGENSVLNKENEKLKKKISELNEQNNTLNSEIKEKEDNLKLIQEKYNSLKNEKSNKNDIENLIEKNNLILKEKLNLENEIKKMNIEHKNILDEMLLSKGELDLKYSETIKENEKLQEKIKQLSILQDNLEDQLNTLNIKYKENKKILTEKEKELNDLKEASQAILIKQKNLIEKENTIDKDKCKIITDKIHNNLKWYLIYEKKNNEINIEEQYDNYRWVTGLIIKDEYLDRYNKYQSDTQRIKDLEDYVLNLQKKLEAKEESMSKLDYKNKKLIQEIHNKTGETRHIHNVLSRGVSSKIKKNTSTELSTNCNDNIFAELNKKKDKINDEEKIANLMSQQKVDEFLNKNAGEEEDFDEVKQIQKQMKFLKKELKETRNILELLTDQVKELIKNVKCDNKNKPQIVQICQLLNLSPETTKRIVTNNKKGIKI